MKWNEERIFFTGLTIFSTCLLSTLKATGIIDLSYLWMFSPIWIAGLLIIILFLFKLIILR